MLFFTTCKMAMRNLLANKLRSLLSMLGIIIGVSAVIVMLAVGAGAQARVLEHVTALGSNLIMVMPGQPRSGGVRGGAVETLLPEDAVAMREKVPGIRGLSPVVRGSGQFKYYNRNKQASIMGVNSEYLRIRNFSIDQGRAFTDLEIEQRAKVALLGSDTAKELFGTSPAVREKIKINGQVFQVVGVLKPKGTQGPFSFDDQALVPYTTAMHRMLGTDYLSEIDIQIVEGVKQAEVQIALERLLRLRHKILPEKEDDFNVRNMAEMVAAVTSISQTFTLLLGAVAAISMVVGGIGIMNIMLVTVTERTREIGVRKAIGAQDRDILVQFLLESTVMSSLGGFLGVVAGISIALCSSWVTTFSAVIEFRSGAMALLFAVGVGIFFGFYPARRAAQLDPIDALGRE